MLKRKHELTTDCKINWDLCIICQSKNLRLEIRCPTKSNRSDAEITYSNFEKNVNRFVAINQLPEEFKSTYSRIDEGFGITQSLLSHNAVWHKNCHTLFNDRHYSLAQNRHKKLQEHGENCPEDIAAPPLPPFSPVKPRCRSKSLCTSNKTDPICVFCNNVKQDDNLHRVLTLKMHNTVTAYANELNDHELLAKIGRGDMVAIDSYYHKDCLTVYSNRARHASSKQEYNSSEESVIHGIVFAELVEYLEEFRVSAVAKIHLLADLCTLYTNRLKALNESLFASYKIRSTTLKEKLIAALPGLEAAQEGRDMLIYYGAGVGSMMRSSLNTDHTSEGRVLTNAVKIIRRDIQDSSGTPPSLLALVSAIMNGGINSKSSLLEINDADNATIETRVAAKTISQLIIYNSTRKCKSPQNLVATTVRHSAKQETTVTVLVALEVYSRTRSKDIVDILHNLGICVSYKRLITLMNIAVNKICELYKEIDLVCPPHLKKGVFTTSAIDNIDHDPSSTFSDKSFHGTAISLLQHPSSASEINTYSSSYVNSISESSGVAQLPDSYATVPTTNITGKIYNAETSNICSEGNIRCYQNAVLQENEWLEYTRTHQNPENKDINNWSTHHSMQNRLLSKANTIIALLPLFDEYAASYPMLLHAMNIIKKAIQYLNKDQCPVINGDQPIYANLKIIQWTCPDTHGEEQFVVMFGGLHIEMAMLKALGKWLQNSGWTSKLTEAGIMTEGRAESTLSGTQVTRARYAHQVSVAALYSLLYEAYEDATSNTPKMSKPEFETWKSSQCLDNKMFKFWNMVIEMEINMLIYVRSLREANFDLYIQALIAFIPWFFALDHHRYARWLTVHIRDMKNLHITHPEVFKQFINGDFTGRKSQNPFSAIAQDQVHEQINAEIKGDGGLIGITNNESASLRWTIAGPEMTRVIQQLEEEMGISRDDLLGTGVHHENSKSHRIRFATDLNNLINVLKSSGNPFSEEKYDLFALDTLIVLEENHASKIMQTYDLGKEQYEKFEYERLNTKTTPFINPIKLNKGALFSNSIVKHKNKSKDAKCMALMNDQWVFSRMWFACERSGGDKSEFFKYENQELPPSLASSGAMRSGTKSDLLPILEAANTVTTSCHVGAPNCDTKIFDGAALVNMCVPTTVTKSFKEYAHSFISTFITSTNIEIKRLDFVFDVYILNSIKHMTRVERGSGTRCIVRPDAPLPSPKKWPQFLRNAENKQELFLLLADFISNLGTEDREIWCTRGENVISSRSSAVDTSIDPCTHEEADTRIILHAAHAVKQGNKNIMIRTVDTDVVVLCIAYFKRINAQQLWVHFGTGNKRRYIPIHEITASLGPQKSIALPLFHSLTGCDTTSSFAGRGKKKAWNTWTKFTAVTDTFIALSSPIDKVMKKDEDLIERFIVLMYNKNLDLASVNEAREELFIRRDVKLLENLPPTQDALTQHIRRAVYQGGHVWGQCLTAQPVLPDLNSWGWCIESSHWEPIWRTLPLAQDTLVEFIKCGCKKGCNTKKCSCLLMSLKCSKLCACEGCKNVT